MASRRSPLRRLRKRLAETIGPSVLSAVLRMLAVTLRIRRVDADDLFNRWNAGERVIIAFWHSRLLMMPIVGRGQKICIMNSEHRDGQLASRAIERWGIRTVSGSATRGGVKGFLALVRTFRQGYSLAVVPDGPRGPAESAKPGVIYLGKATGADIVPVSYSADRYWRLRSWDRMLIPKPFANVAFVVGKPIKVDRHCEDEQAEALRIELERRLVAAGERAAAEFAGKA